MHELALSDRVSLREAIQAKAALDYDIQIGGRAPVKKQIDPIKLKEQLERVRFYSLLYGELKQLLHEVDFGYGTEAAYSEGRALIVVRMQSLSPEQDVALKQVLPDSAMLPPTELQTRLRQQLHSLFNEADWQQIMATAAVGSKLRERVARV